MPRFRHEDDVTDSTVQGFVRRRAKGWGVSLAIAFGTAFCTIAGIRAIPGGLVVGSAHDLAQLQIRVDTLNYFAHASDRTTNERVALTEIAIARLEGFADAVTREKCATFGAARAKAWGYDCDGAIAPLPIRR